jgi:hypothetical protein
MKFEVGQQVVGLKPVSYRQSQEPRVGVVTSVGRKYFTVDIYRDAKFLLETGEASTENGHPVRIYPSWEVYHLEMKMAADMATLRSYFAKGTWGLSYAKVTQLLAILTKEEEETSSTGANNVRLI